MVATKDSLACSALSVMLITFSDCSDAVSVRCAFDDTITGSMRLLLQPPTRGARLKLAAWASPGIARRLHMIAGQSSRGRRVTAPRGERIALQSIVPQP